MLSILAFFNQLTDVLGLAQQTYNLESHKQFAKHLTGLLKHTLQYATNYYILYRYAQIFVIYYVKFQRI